MLYSLFIVKYGVMSHPSRVILLICDASRHKEQIHGHRFVLL